jgi:phosphate transport system substrate-binding protein
MYDRKQIKFLLITMVVSLGLVGGVFLWLANNSSIKLPTIKNNRSQELEKSKTESFAQVTNIPSQELEKSKTESFAQVTNIPSGLFRYGGANAWGPIREEVDFQIQTAFPQFQLGYTEPPTGVPNSATGINMLLDNQLSFSQSTRSIKNEEYQKAQERGFTLREIPVAIDGIAIAVNPNLNISGLTLAQLKDIYTGKVTNWQQLGGPNLAITPYSKTLGLGGEDAQLLVEKVLENEQFGVSVQFISTTTQALREVAKNPGGIFYASAPAVVKQCSVKPISLGRTSDKLIPPYQEPFIPLSQCPQQRNQPNTTAFQSDEYPMTRQLFVVVKQNGHTGQQAGEAYANLLLTDQGQELITKAGFVRIR